MNKVELFNQTEKEITELDTVLKVLDSALKKENLDNVLEKSVIQYIKNNNLYQ